MEKVNIMSTLSQKVDFLSTFLQCLHSVLLLVKTTSLSIALVYRECDENFVYNEMVKNYSMMPFWAAKKIDEITDIAYMRVKILELD